MTQGGTAHREGMSSWLRRVNGGMAIAVQAKLRATRGCLTWMTKMAMKIQQKGVGLIHLLLGLHQHLIQMLHLHHLLLALETHKEVPTSDQQLPLP